MEADGEDGVECGKADFAFDDGLDVVGLAGVISFLVVLAPLDEGLFEQMVVVADCPLDGVDETAERGDDGC